MPDAALIALDLARSRARDSFSRYHTTKGKSIEKLSREESPCRLTVVLQHRKDTSRGRVVQVQCKVKTCEHCGPEYRRRKAAHFIRQAEGKRLHRIEIDSGDWSRVRKRLSGKGSYLRVPVADGRCVVLSTVDVGPVVVDVAHAVTSTFEAMADDSGNVTSSRDWCEPSGHKESEWTRLGTSDTPVAEVAEQFDGISALGQKIDSTRVNGWEVTFPVDEHGKACVQRIYNRIHLRRRRSVALAA